MKYNVGDTVPDFEMESTDGTVFRLSEAVKKNPVLVNFYVGDFGINCTNYMTKFNERIGEIAQKQGFGESVLTIPANLKNGNWPLITPAFALMLIWSKPSVADSILTCVPTGSS